MCPIIVLYSIWLEGVHQSKYWWILANNFFLVFSDERMWFDKGKNNSRPRRSHLCCCFPILQFFGILSHHCKSRIYIYIPKILCKILKISLAKESKDMSNIDTFNVNMINQSDKYWKQRPYESTLLHLRSFHIIVILNTVKISQTYEKYVPVSNACTSCLRREWLMYNTRINLIRRWSASFS